VAVSHLSPVSTMARGEAGYCHIVHPLHDGGVAGACAGVGKWGFNRRMSEPLLCCRLTGASGYLCTTCYLCGQGLELDQQLFHRQLSVDGVGPGILDVRMLGGCVGEGGAECAHDVCSLSQRL
jgi:hypothetical protein